MKRDLIKQMRNEGRDNLWLIIGLIIVTIAIWWLAVKYYNKVNWLFYKKGFDTENVYQVNIGKYPSSSPLHTERSEEEASLLDASDLRMLIDAIRKSPYVEAAAFSYNGLPYSYTYIGMRLVIDIEPEDSIGYDSNFRYVSPDMVRVLKLTSRTGKSETEIEDKLRNGELLISNVFRNIGEDHYHTPEELNGRNVHIEGQDKIYRVGDIIDHIRRSEYDQSFGGTVLFPINETENITATQIGIRLKPETGDKFRKEFESTPAMRSVGNHFLYQLTSMTDQAKSIQKTESTDARMSLIMIMVFVVIIIIGMVGIFWFRVQQKFSEIAIRKICGASSKDIFRRIISEGIILLSIASLVAAAIGWPLMKITLMQPTNPFDVPADYITVFLLEVATFVILALGITISLCWPAYRAMKIQPAITIKDE